jgi:hypothetical protein
MNPSLAALLNRDLLRLIPKGDGTRKSRCPQPLSLLIISDQVNDQFQSLTRGVTGAPTRDVTAEGMIDGQPFPANRQMTAEKFP